HIVRSDFPQVPLRRLRQVRRWPPAERHGAGRTSLTITLYDVIKVRTLCAPPFPPETSVDRPMNIEVAREQMIEQQVRAWDVFDERVLAVMREIRREQFAPARYQDVAFADSPIPLSHGQSMLPAKIQGRILQALAPGAADVVLEIGAGNGYLSACLGRLAARVRSF